MCSVSAQGSAHSRLRRALDHGASGLVVRALAQEAGRLGLDEALAVCLVLLEQEPEQYERWAARWGSRFVREADGLDLEQSAFALAALAAMRGRARLPAARALEELCELGGQQRSAAVLERWLAKREL
jgi:hypothetical protein